MGTFLLPYSLPGGFMRLIVDFVPKENRLVMDVVGETPAEYAMLALLKRSNVQPLFYQRQENDHVCIVVPFPEAGAAEYEKNRATVLPVPGAIPDLRHIFGSGNGMLWMTEPDRADPIHRSPSVLVGDCSVSYEYDGCTVRMGPLVKPEWINIISSRCTASKSDSGSWLFLDIEGQRFAEFKACVTSTTNRAFRLASPGLVRCVEAVGWVPDSCY
jgi:hypothetical protein